LNLRLGGVDELRFQLPPRGGIYSSGSFVPTVTGFPGDDVFPVQDIGHGHLLGPTELVGIQIEGFRGKL
jgi:hypothetical protein